MQAQDYSGANAGGSHFFQPNQANFAPAAGADQMQHGIVRRRPQIMGRGP